MQEKSPIKKNILKYLEYKGITKYKFYQETGITRGILDQNNGISEENTIKFLVHYTEVNPDWLILDNEPMIRGDVVNKYVEKEKKPSEPEPVEISKNTFNKIMDRYDLLVADNASLRKEVELLKNTGGKFVNAPDYSISKPQIDSFAADEKDNYLSIKKERQKSK